MGTGKEWAGRGKTRPAPDKPRPNPHAPSLHQQTPVTGWLEAFASHPVLGDKAGLETAPSTTHTSLSKGEQAAVGADPAGAAALAAANTRYVAQFGHTFIAAAAGRSPAELAADLEARLGNPPYAELAVAAAEQMKITERRLASLVGGEVAAPPPPPPASTTGRSPITTHVLDMSVGRPAAGVPVTLLVRPAGAPPAARVWVPVRGGSGDLRPNLATDADGRVSTGLMPEPGPGEPHAPPAGTYRLEFGVGSRGGGASTTWSATPAIEFSVPELDGRHWHVPLTWAPHGYSTYRGS